MENFELSELSREELIALARSLLLQLNEEQIKTLTLF